MSTWKEQRIENAAVDVIQARDSHGLAVSLCNPMDIDDVRRAVVDVANWFEPGGMFIEPSGEYTAAQNLRKLAALLEAHLS